MNEDILWIEQFLAGGKDGFEMLVRKYQDKALNIVYSLIGKDRESEDITQEVFLKVYHNLKFFERRSRFSTWLYRITVNTTYDFLRRRERIINDENLPEKIPAVTGDPWDALLMREKETFVQNALVSIPFKYRTAVVLRDIEGLSYIEISKVLRCSIGTVESRIYRARQFLKERLLRLQGEEI